MHEGLDDRRRFLALRFDIGNVRLNINRFRFSFEIFNLRFGFRGCIYLIVDILALLQ
jgi:hypothetical protein